MEQGKKVTLPVIQRADAARMIREMYGELDDAIARRDAEIGARMACHEGCNACCNSPVLVTEGEAVAIAEWLREPAHADVHRRFNVAYPAWRDALKDLLATSDPSDTEWMLSVQRRHVMCAFNHEGSCTIYPVRPALCRRTHALDTNENCASETVPAKCYEHPETEQVFDAQRPQRFALHKALRPGHHLELLCAAVHRTSKASGPVMRNEPCPCGSGKKYKKCCGT